MAQWMKMTSLEEANLGKASKRERERDEYYLTVIVKKIKLKASSLLLVTLIQICAGFEVQLEL
jgi:hypothetical protein